MKPVPAQPTKSKTNLHVFDDAATNYVLASRPPELNRRAGKEAVVLVGRHLHLVQLGAVTGREVEQPQAPVVRVLQNDVAPADSVVSAEVDIDRWLDSGAATEEARLP